MTTMTALSEPAMSNTDPQNETAQSLRVEAILMSASRPCSAGAIAQALEMRAEDDAVGEVERLIDHTQ